MAAYQGCIFIFEPAENRVSMFDSESRCIQQLSLRMTSDCTSIAIASVANVAFLVQDNVIERIYMDKLIEQMTSRQSAPEAAAPADDIVRSLPIRDQDNVPKSQKGFVKACAVFGDQLIILESHEYTHRNYFLLATNVNTLMQLKQGEMPTLRGLEMNYKNSAKEKLESDWSTAQLFRSVTE